MKKIAIISLLSIVMVLAAASDSYACSCMAPSPDTPMKKIVKDAKSDAGAVFVGKVIAVKTVDGSTDMNAPFYVTIEVTRSWKGVTTMQVEVTTRSSSAACGVSFAVGKEFIVYAYKDAETNTMSASLCSRTQMIAGKSDDEKFLGKRLKLKSA